MVCYVDDLLSKIGSIVFLQIDHGMTLERMSVLSSHKILLTVLRFDDFGGFEFFTLFCISTVCSTVRCVIK